MNVPIEGLLVATLGGAAIGLERQWSGHASGAHARFAGIRTFTMLGGVARLIGACLVQGWVAIAAVLLAGVLAIIALAYSVSRHVDVDATTEVAALVVVAAGIFAGAGASALASGAIAITIVLLLEKPTLHAFAESMSDQVLLASGRFAALALVVLPLLPAGAYGPFGAVRPREIWLMVLFFSGLNFAGWISRRLLGDRRGIVATGVLGGIISSTSVTWSFAHASAANPTGQFALALGAIGACTVMIVRVLIATAVMNLPISTALVRLVWIGLAIGAGVAAISMRRQVEPASGSPPADDSPLQLWTALQMAAVFQLVLIAIGAVIAWWSIQALMVTSAVIGLTDLDALTLSLARGASSVDPRIAAQGLAVGIVSNTLLKAGVAIVVGRGAFRMLVGGTLGAMAVSMAAAIWAWS